MSIAPRMAPLVSASIFLAGCESEALSRSRAKDLLEKAPFFAKPVIESAALGGMNCFLQSDETSKLVVLQAVVYRANSDCFAQLTDYGKEFAVAVTDECAKLKAAQAQVIEVTGISEPDPRGVTIVKYDWAWKPTAVGPVFGYESERRKGQAVFRKYDDGWRVEGDGSDYYGGFKIVPC